VSPVAVVALLIAAFAHAGWNLAAKRIGDGGTLFVWLYQTASVAIYLPVAAAGLGLGGARPVWAWAPAVVVSAVLHNVCAVLLQRGYAVGDLSVVYPVARGSGPLLSVSAAVVLLGERPGPLALAGAAGVVLGVLVIGLAPGRRRESTAAGAGWGALTGATIAAFTLWDAHSVTALGMPPLGLFCARAVLQSLMLTPYALRRRRPARQLWRRHRTRILIVSVLGPLASVSVLYALRLAPVSVVAPVRELSVVITSLAAWRLLGEPNPQRRLAGAAVVLAGITAIALAG
jgi:drug/metabolite transporter (DMT)-like permease